MAEGILANPFMQGGDMIALAPRTVVANAGTWVKIADQQSMRMTITVVKGTLDDLVYLSPFNTGTTASIATGANALPLQIHIADYPLLIQGVWYARAGQTQNLTIVETIRLQDNPNVHAGSAYGGGWDAAAKD